MEQDWPKPNHGTPWSEEDKSILVGLYCSNKSLCFIAKRLGRKEYAIRCQLDNINSHRTFDMYKGIYLQNNSEFIPRKEEKKIVMKNNMVTTRTFVGDVEATTLSTEQLLSAIEQEEMFVKRLSTLNSQTVKVQKLCKKHRDNISKLCHLIGD